MPKKKHYLESILDLNASNIWGTDVQEIVELWERDIKEDDFPMYEDKVLNMLSAAYDVFHFDPKDDRELARYSNPEFVILSGSAKKKGTIAIRKKQIRQISDLSYENIRHLSAAELLKLIDRNFGGGWDSISLSVKDIIESAFDISTTTLPASRIHADGGTLQRKVADGYDVLEISKGTWTEAIFAKKREPIVKPRFKSESDAPNINGSDDLTDTPDTDDSPILPDDTTPDDTFYESYTPEADIKSVQDALEED